MTGPLIISLLDNNKDTIKFIMKALIFFPVDIQTIPNEICSHLSFKGVKGQVS